MENLITEINKILTQYLQEEIGNRVSQFSMKGLRDVVITTIQNYKPVKQNRGAIPFKKEVVKK